MSQKLYIDNDNRIKFVGLMDADGNYQNSALMTVTLQDSAGTNVPGDSWPLTMPYVAGSNGDYQATLQDGLTLAKNENYTAIIDVNSGGLTAQFDVQLTAQKRTIQN